MPLSIGAKLKIIRESQGLSLETISQKTHIALDYLKAIERNDEESLPSKVQSRGFLRLYANTLGINLEDLSADDYLISQAEPPLEIASKVEQDPESVAEVPFLEGKQDSLSVKNSEPTLPTDDKTELITPFPPHDFIDYDPSENNNHIETSASVFLQLGNDLKQRRESLSISVNDVFKTIYISEEYIISMESGNFDLLPSPVQGKGMLVNYAEFLNFNIDSILSTYTSGLQLQHLEKQQGILVKPKKPAKELTSFALRLKTFFSLDLLIIVTMFLIFASFVIWGANRIIKRQSPHEIENNLPDVSEILLATPTPTTQLAMIIEDEEHNGSGNDSSSTEENESLLLFTPAPSTDPINLILIPRQRLWVEVTSDEEVVFRGRLIPGNAYDFSGQNRVEILTGNAGSLQIIINDQDIGSFGMVGQVANLSFTELGLEQPSVILTPVIVETPTSTPTPGEIDE